MIKKWINNTTFSLLLPLLTCVMYQDTPLGIDHFGCRPYRNLRSAKAGPKANKEKDNLVPCSKQHYGAGADCHRACNIINHTFGPFVYPPLGVPVC